MLQTDGSKHYLIEGDLFFGSVGDFEKALDVKNDPTSVVLDFKHSNITDMGALESINKMTRKYQALDKKLLVTNLDEKSRALLGKAASLSLVQEA